MNCRDMPSRRAGRARRPRRHAEQGLLRDDGHAAAQRRAGRSEDITLAARNALINMIDYIADAYSFTREQAYCLASVAVDLRISQVVDG